jgi:hypothetical protein
MAGDCTHHDRNKDPLVVRDTELMKLLLQLVVKRSIYSGYLVVVQGRQS